MEERKIYKKEELKALKDWFANQDLPQGLQVVKISPFLFIFHYLVYIRKSLYYSAF